MTHDPRRRRLVEEALHVLRLAPLTTSIIVELDGVLHLVDRCQRDDDAMCEHLTLACGRQERSDLELPVAQARRGSWQAPEMMNATLCAGCRQHEGRFPQAAEHDGDAGTTKQVAGDVLAALPTATADDEAWRRASVGELARRARAASAGLVPELLARSGEPLIAEHGVERVAAVLAEEDWRELVDNVMEDLYDDSDDARLAAAAVYLFGDVRAIVAERLRTPSAQVVA